jgi:hypothetical protein
MFVQPITKTTKTSKFVLTPEEKQARKAMIDKLTEEVMLRAEEFMPRSAITRANTRKAVAKAYDLKIREKIMAAL